MANCKSCGAEIIWKRTTANRSIPLDAKPEKRCVLFGQDGCTVVDTYQVHFVSCPQAAEHRKKEH